MSKSERKSDDPLKHADIGESVTVRDTAEFHTIDFEPDEFWGSDRFGNAKIVDTEVTSDEYGGETLTVTLEGEVTKQLPRRWDYCQEPRTEKERKVARNRKLARLIIHALSLLLPIGLVFAVSTKLMSSVSGKMTVDGEPLVFPTFLDLIPLFFGVIVFSGLVAVLFNYVTADKFRTRV